MHIHCTRCQRTLEFSGDRPLFCAYCGQSLAETKVHDTAPDPAQAATLPPAPAVPDGNGAPDVVGGYRLLRPLGSGGMGTVFEAEEISSGRRVALKLISADYAGSRDAVERFRREGRLASTIAHPRCVFVLAADEEAGRPYIVMELMRGSTLEDVVAKQGPLPVEQAVARILDVMEGLEEAHRLGVIHRDVKPSNCFLDADGRVKIGDFGLSKSLVRDARLTKTGSFMGTPLYASPEQVRAEPLDEQTDVYSVAATLYFLLAGRAPHQTNDATATLAAIVADPAPPVRKFRKEVPASLDKVVLRGLEKDRKRRYRNLEEFRKALLPFLPAEPSVGDLGVRFGAWVVDHVVLGVLQSALLVPLLISAGAAAGTVSARGLEGQGAALGAGSKLLAMFVFVAYFGLFEGWKGWTPGKWLVRLRVVGKADNRPPGVSKAALRALVLTLILNAPDWAILGGSALGWVSADRDRFTQISNTLVFIGATAVLNISSFALLFGTMRTRNGYRGLYEFASDTRVVRLHWPRFRRRGRIRMREYHPETTQPLGLPARLGPYSIRGALRWEPAERTLMGEDRSLERSVWIWLRPASETPLDAARRGISRTTRIRWVGGSVEGGWQWDAFLAPAGCPLPTLVVGGQPLAWPEARVILEDLSEELAASCAEGTLPQTLTSDQVWVDAKGRVQLLGTPLNADADKGTSTRTSEVALTEQQRALHFLREVAVLALEGRPRPPDTPPAPVRAAIPQHAERIVNRLLGAWTPTDWVDVIVNRDLLAWSPAKRNRPFARVEELRAELTATQDHPAEITRPRRAVHLLMTALLLHLPFGGPFMILFFPLMDLLSPRGRLTDQEIGLALVFVALNCGFYVVWAFLLRGGVAFHRSLVLRRPDGRRVARWRCAWRAFVVWAPFATLICLSFKATELFPNDVWLSAGIFLAAPLLLLGYAVLAVLFPTRSLHDRLAGTCVVPR